MYFAVATRVKRCSNGRKKRFGRYIEKARKDRLKKRLEEASKVELSSTGSDLDSKKSDDECNNNGVVYYGSSTGVDISQEFDTLSSGTAEQLNIVLDEYELHRSVINNNGSVWDDSSDPSLDGCIIGLTDSSK